MLAHETVLRQRYSLSFFTTTFLIALTTQSSLAFSINPLGPAGATESWKPEKSYTLVDDETTGITFLSPIAVTSITRGGTPEFLVKLKESFPSWNFNSADNDLAGSFKVKKYEAVGEYDMVGAKIELLYEPGAGDPTPLGNSLQWIQRVTNNHKREANHGENGDSIDIGDEVNTPFYDTQTYGEMMSGGLPLPEGLFSDFSFREDADKNHTWLAQLYLVDHQPESQNVTIYNGIEWGWENKVESVPEPVTIFGSGMGLGLGILFKKKVQSTRKQKVSKS